MIGGGLIYQGTAGSFPPGPPPSPVLVGNFIMVSKVGNDATGTREDFVFHFLTIGAALAIAQPGDIIVVQPGTYNESLTLNVNGVTIYFEYGATLTNSGDLLTIFLFDSVVTGYGNFVAT